MNAPILVREWDADVFHAQVLALEGKGYIARRESYSIAADMNPETGYIVHLYTIEMYPPEPQTA